MSYFRKSYDDLRRFASEFLAKYHPGGHLPIPIEEIADFGLQLNIAPIPGLLDNFHVDGYLARGRDTIFVDQFVSEERENRFRFTLAYEIGRYLLQEKIIGSCEIDSLESYLKWHEDLPDETREMAKWESYDFAGLVLVPTQHLNRELRQARDECFARFRAAGYDPDQSLNPIWIRIAARLADEVFQVSNGVVAKRLQKEGLLPEGVEL